MRKTSDTLDGRVARSERSRAAIVQALYDLVGEGILQPTAQQVAERASVGIRTVFRHFSDMDSLLAEIDGRVRAQALGLFREERVRGSRAVRARALLEQRIRLFEQIAPYKRSGNISRWRVAFVARRQLAHVRDLRTDLLAWFPELRAAPAEVFEALDAALSFEVWDRLRTDQRLGRERAAAALERMVFALLDTVGRASCGEREMSGETPKIVGAPGSPYSRKLRAVMRYRRIPFVWVQAGGPEARGLPKPRVELLPQLIVRGTSGALEARVDSTPLIRELESRYDGRSVIPPDPVVAYLDALLEDYADEWLTKAMFHYRWVYPDDIAKASAILPRWRRTDQPESEALALGKMFAERQIGRLGVVGSNATTGAVIEESYRRLLRLLAAQLERSRFVMGGRPGASDFGLFGQLTQLAGFDPTPTAVALEIAPRVVSWVEVFEELSGLEPADQDWLTRDAIPDTLRALLAEVGRVYVPFLLANADALARGAERVECTIDGRAWVQQPFPYQGKCLQWLHEGRAALSADDRAALDAVLAGTGCERLFAV